MPSYRKLWLTMVVGTGLGLLFCMVAKAQDTPAERHCASPDDAQHHP